MKTTLLRLVALSLLFTVTACAPGAPVTVYVTPTPPPSIGGGDAPANITYQRPSTLVPTAVSLAQVPTSPPQIGPIIGGAAEPTVPPTTAPVEPPRVVTASGPMPTEFMGPIIGPDYTLPPTDTPAPTDTPTPGPSPMPTATPGATQPPAPTRPAVAGTPLPTFDASRFGVQVDWNLELSDWEDAVGKRIEGDLMAQWLKVQIPWKDLQPNGPQDFSDVFRRVEQALEYADREQLHILISIAKAPAWARSNHNEDGPPDDPQLLANFIAFFLEQIPFVDAIEIWNEPNLEREWQGTLPFNGEGYMRLFGPAYGAIKGVAPHIIPVTAGLAPTGNNPGSRDDRQYLREMYQAGLGRYTDIAVGIHPYGWANPPDALCCGTRGWDDDPHFFFAETMRDYRELMNAFGQSQNQLWPTEFGWATWQDLPGEPPEQWVGWVDKWAQANYTLRAIEIFESTPGIGPYFLWNLNFAILGNLVQQRDERAGYSLLVPLPVMERPLYWMLYDAMRPDVQLDRYD